MGWFSPADRQARWWRSGSVDAIVDRDAYEVTQDDRGIVMSQPQSTFEGVQRIMDVASLYERYLEISRINEVFLVAEEETMGLPKFYAPLPSPLTLTLIAR